MEQNNSPHGELTEELSELRQKVQQLERKAADSDETIQALDGVIVAASEFKPL